jgi:UDP-glucuronate decarboxylase
VHPQKETYWGNVNPTGPRACYDEGKRAAETLAFDSERAKRVDVRVARIFNTYGPRMRADDGRVVSNIICQALSGGDITIYGDGKQTRSFCYMSDLIDGFMRLMAYEGKFPGAVNLGNPIELTVMDLADKILSLTNSSSRIVKRPLPMDDPRRRRPDITRAQQLLGWVPRTPLEAGLKATISWFSDEQPDEDEPTRAAVVLSSGIPA